ncbi:MAG: SRPBCC domain-containing protein [Bdellovibrionaceae bacterium]|nr:SRPBCC domain-containing protein [Pseudobdellovibrionaceae bacterium]
MSLVACAGTHKQETPPAPKTEDVVITRVFKAPRDQVWKTWTEPERIKKWWGPKKYSAPVVKNDLRIGGKYLYAMKSPQGQIYWSTGTYQDLDVHARIIATDSFADENGNVVSPTTYGMPADTPNELHVIVTFEEEDKGKTTLTIKHMGMPPGQMAEMTKAGWNESLDKFAVALKSKK